MKFFQDDSGIAYGIVMGIIFLAISIFAWMFVGILIDHLEINFNSMSHLFSDSMGDRVTDTVNIHSYLPALFLMVFFLYLIVKGLRRNTDFG